MVIEHKEDLNPQIIVKDSSGNPIATYSVPTGAQVAVDEGTRIDAGSIIAKTPRQASKTQDITGGLPRVAELFEARRPKEGNVGQMAKIDGIVSEAGTLRSKRGYWSQMKSQGKSKNTHSSWKTCFSPAR